VLGSVCVAGGRRRDEANVLLAPVCVCVCVCVCVVCVCVCVWSQWTTFATCMPYALHMRMHIGCVNLVHVKRVCACQEPVPVFMSRAQVQIACNPCHLQVKGKMSLENVTVANNTEPQHSMRTHT
jgi:hypothetical protein